MFDLILEIRLFKGNTNFEDYCDSFFQLDLYSESSFIERKQKKKI